MTHIDILLITYNRPQLLAHTLRSLAEQTYSDFTVHVVDNGSQPALDPAMVPAGLDVRWERKEANQRQTDIGNAFLVERQPPLFVSLADDDVWSPHMLEMVALLFEQNQDMESHGVGFTHFDHERGEPCVKAEYLRSFSGELQRFDGSEAGEVPHLEHSPLRACSFVNMGTDNHLKVLHRNGISKQWDTTLQMEFFLRHIDEICADETITEETMRDLAEAVPLAIETSMRELKLEGAENRQRCKDEVLNFIKERSALHANAHAHAQMKAAAWSATATPCDEPIKAHQDIVTYAAWQEQTIELSMLRLDASTVPQQRSGARQ